MNDESSGTLRKPVSRADFFRWGADSLKQLGKEMISNKLEQLEGNLGGSNWNRVTDENSIGIIPRLFFVKGTPVYVAKEATDILSAFSAHCPEDGGLLEWRDNVKSFCCPFCQSKFDREGKSYASDTELIKHAARVSEGQLLVRLTDHQIR